MTSGSPNAPVLFIADLHLHPDDPATTRDFETFLAREAMGARALHVMGDLFDHWVSPRQEAEPFFRRVLDALAAVVDGGVDVSFQAGNRDFLLTGGPLRRRGIVEHLDWHGTPVGDDAVLLTHGDLLCTRDRPYQRMRSLLRLPVVPLLSRALTLRFALGLGTRFRGVSKTAVAAKAPGVAEIAPEAVCRRLSSGVWDVIVCGHVHRPRIERHHVAGRERLLVVLPDWSRGAGWAEALDGRWRVHLPGGGVIEANSSTSKEAPITLSADYSGSEPMDGIVVAIDGPAGSGKSTLAHRLADELDLCTLDTGAMYRAVALAADRRSIAPEDDVGLEALVAAIELRLEPSGDGGLRVMLDGEDVSVAIRTEEVSRIVALYASRPVVRKAMVALQRAQRRSSGRGIVVEGRDIGTVVFPDADHKFYLEADAAERAKRRLRDLGDGSTLEAVKRDIENRDSVDSGRADSPLRPAEDAIRIDTTDLTIDEVLARMIGRVQGR